MMNSLAGSNRWPWTIHSSTISRYGRTVSVHRENSKATWRETDRFYLKCWNNFD